MSGLAIRNVRKSYGAVDIIHGVDVDIADGEFVILVGPSGCGKSTLLKNDRRAGGNHRGRDFDRRSRRQQSAAQGSKYRDGVPEHTRSIRR